MLKAHTFIKIKSILPIIILMLVSCTGRGPLQLPPDRMSYNRALQYSDDQQTLLNIVRLRYSDTPYFLTVNNIVSQFNFRQEATGGVATNSTPPPSTLWNVGGTASVIESPTITYFPLQGEEYVTRLLTPIDLGVVYMFLRAGWGVSHVLRMLVQRMGPVENAVIASRTTSSRIPRYKEFLAITSVLRKLQYRENLETQGQETGKVFTIRITVRSFGGLNVKERQLLSYIGLTPSAPSVWLTNDFRPKPHYLYVQTRTVLGLFSYLSKGVDVPQEHLINRKAPITYYPNGKKFNWHNVIKGMIRIRSAKRPPVDTVLCVKYKNYWYYIPDNDFDSKETLHMLAIVAGIYQGNIKAGMPVFTIR